MKYRKENYNDSQSPMVFKEVERSLERMQNMSAMGKHAY